MKNCSLLKTCQLTYAADPKTFCPGSSKKEECPLLRDIKDGNVDPFIMSIIRKQISDLGDEEKALTRQICPRSGQNKIYIPKQCLLQTCPYYNKNVIYRCMHIHAESFFGPEKGITNNLIDVAFKLIPKTRKQVTSISIALMRMVLIILKYKGESMGRGKITKLLKIGEWKSTCEICQATLDPTITETCECVLDPDLRSSRLGFIKSWHFILSQNSDFGDEEDEFPDISVLKSSQYMRHLLRSLNVGGTYLKDIPFGYAFEVYSSLFSESDEVKMNNFGLNRMQYNAATRLFGNGNKETNL